MDLLEAGRIKIVVRNPAASEVTMMAGAELEVPIKFPSVWGSRE